MVESEFIIFIQSKKTFFRCLKFYWHLILNKLLDICSCGLKVVTPFCTWIRRFLLSYVLYNIFFNISVILMWINLHTASFCGTSVIAFVSLHCDHCDVCKLTDYDCITAVVTYSRDAKSCSVLLVVRVMSTVIHYISFITFTSPFNRYSCIFYEP